MLESGCSRQAGEDFADLFMVSYTLAVHNWTGTPLWSGGTGNNTDQIYFNRALGSGELDRISN